ncbi:helix-turn-helix domain-containing protein [Glycomyces harbinensis]|uniref:Helix-turn-helix domain-containing protein n=1 Tax=Glycomyces harbinensis TaxID=58114 RepID=A0A1G6TWS1_9ACTN|nr:XRE family transcriptional regulator [Glycomyces harbinensis]SDD33560.1 Helix-turn-helix domain-containing protein [Glycomyces harbinensis]
MVCEYRYMSLDSEWAAVGERIRRARVAGGLSQGKLAEAIGLDDRSVISKIEHGERRVDGMELARLSEALRVPMRQFLEDPPRQIVSRRNGLVAEETTSEERVDFRVQTELVAWAYDADQLCELNVLSIPELMRYQGAQSNAEEIRSAARWLRRCLGLADQPVESLLAEAQRAGVLLAVIEIECEGASMHYGDFAVGVVNRHSDFGRRRATAAHELGHMVLGDEYTSEIGVHASKNEREALVDAFASEFLLPAAAFGHATAKLNRTGLIEKAAEYRVSWTLAIRQAQLAGALNDGDAKDWAARKPTQAEFMDAIGWVPQPDLEKMTIAPMVAHAVMQAYTKSLITATRAVEIMRGQLDTADLPEIEPQARDRW